MNFTSEEMNFLCIVIGLEREDTLNNVFDAIPDIEDDEMKKLAEVLISKLDIMPDAKFIEISFDKTCQNIQINKNSLTFSFSCSIINKQRLVTL